MALHRIWVDPVLEALDAGLITEDESRALSGRRGHMAAEGEPIPEALRAKHMHRCDDCGARQPDGWSRYCRACDVPF